MYIIATIHTYIGTQRRIMGRGGGADKNSNWTQLKVTIHIYFPHRNNIMVYNQITKIYMTCLIEI